MKTSSLLFTLTTLLLSLHVTAQPLEKARRQGINVCGDLSSISTEITVLTPTLLNLDIEVGGLLNDVERIQGQAGC